MANLPITLYPGMKIGQISFLRMTTPADRPYGSTGPGVQVPGPAGTDPQPVLENFALTSDRPVPASTAAYARLACLNDLHSPDTDSRRSPCPSGSPSAWPSR